MIINGLRVFISPVPKWCKSKGIIGSILANMYLFLKYHNVDIVYSALSGRDVFFLLAKKLKLKKYKIVSIIHHPGSKLIFTDQYDKMIFISKETYIKYSDKSNSCYLFWGPDMDFYNQYYTEKKDCTYDFISAGKTHRDHLLFNKIIPNLTNRYMVIDGINGSNTISDVEVMNLYNRSKFAVIPLITNITTENSLKGLTSFVDALGMGLPILMSDNSNIGIDIEKLGIGLFYKAGDKLDFQNKATQLLNLTATEYRDMRARCRNYGVANNFEAFSERVKHMLI